jgi:hypothetical protein
MSRIHRVRGGRSFRLPTEPCVRVRTRLLMQGVSIEKRNNAAMLNRWHGRWTKQCGNPK